MTLENQVPFQHVPIDSTPALSVWLRLRYQKLMKAEEWANEYSCDLIRIVQFRTHADTHWWKGLTAAWRCLKPRSPRNWNNQLYCQGPRQPWPMLKISVPLKLPLSAHNPHTSFPQRFDETWPVLWACLAKYERHCPWCATTHSSILLRHMLCRWNGKHHETMDHPFQCPQDIKVAKSIPTGPYIPKIPAICNQISQIERSKPAKAAQNTHRSYRSSNAAKVQCWARYSTVHVYWTCPETIPRCNPMRSVSLAPADCWSTWSPAVVPWIPQSTSTAVPWTCDWKVHLECVELYLLHFRLAQHLDHIFRKATASPHKTNSSHATPVF